MYSSILRRLSSLVAKLLNQYDRVLLALLSVVIVITGTFWFKQYAKDKTDGPSVGGTYVQGVIGDSSEIEALSAEIVKSGLFSYNMNGELQNNLIESWDSNPEKTGYSFKLKAGVNADSIVTELNNNLDLFGSATFEQDGQTIKATFLDSNPNLPLLLSQPLFDYGPYKLSKNSGNTTIITRSNDAVSLPANFNKIVIHHYLSEAELQEALTKKKIDGSYYFEGMNIPSGYQIKETQLARYFAVVLNINKSPFREDTFRISLINGQNVPAKDFVLTVPDQEPQKTLATALMTTWQAQGAKVTLDLKPLAEIRDNLAPSRNFQAMIVGLDYGAELDPYYIWHSSQIRPPSNNISGFKNDQVDAKLAQIRATYNTTERKKLTEELHQLLKAQGVMLVLRQESQKYVLSDSVVSSNAPIPQASHDLVQDVKDWWIK